MSNWTELWSVGSGVSRIYCGIAKTPDGTAVDIFQGDTCIDSELYPTRREAVEAALRRKALWERDWRRGTPNGMSRAVTAVRIEDQLLRAMR